MNNEIGINIGGTFVEFSELRADVNAAITKGMIGKYAFTPETVEALLDYIHETADVFTGEGGFATEQDARAFDKFESLRREMYE